MRILIYAFKKFDKLSSNPSREVGKVIFDILKEKKFDVRLDIFSVNYNFKGNLERVIFEFKPNFILGLGAAKRNKVTVEAIALNVIHHPKGDEKGVVMVNKNVTEGSEALKTSFDCQRLVNYLKKEEIPCDISYFAGTYICNNSYFRCLKFIRDKSLTAETVFVHVPLSPKEVNLLGIDAPSFPPALIGQALAKFLESYKN